MHVAVVGAGPAGLIAAETLAGHGHRVEVFDARRSPGRKFLLAGRSGLNLTFEEPLDALIARYGAAADFLEPALRSFPPAELRAWAESLGHPTFVGTSGRVFPNEMRATPLLRSWLNRLADHGVVIHTGHRWTGWGSSGEVTFVADDSPVRTTPDATVFALGGASWPSVSSDGSWAALFEAQGVAITPFAAANCGVRVAWSAPMMSTFEGTPIKNAIFSVGGHERRGDAVITAAGLEGGPIYALGPAIRSIATGGAVELRVDLHPDTGAGELTRRLSQRRVKASQSSWFRSAKIAPVSVGLLREATGNRIPDQPANVAGLLKALPIRLSGLAPIERAISTAGGVALDQLTAHGMIRERPGTFVAGEMMDWEAPTGGYLLQACFSTGQAAAEGVRLLSNP